MVTGSILSLSPACSPVLGLLPFLPLSSLPAAIPTSLLSACCHLTSLLSALPLSSLPAAILPRSSPLPSPSSAYYMYLSACSYLTSLLCSAILPLLLSSPLPAAV